MKSQSFFESTTSISLKSLRWWKVKIRGSSQDTDSPVGLVPAAYVEQVNPYLFLQAGY
jgi:hypothetical protein